VNRPADAGPADRLRLAFLADANSIHTRRWISWFARAGHEVTLVDPFSADISPGLEHGIHVVRDDEGAGRGPFGGLRRARWLRRVVKRLGSPVLHAHFVRRYGWLGHPERPARAGPHPSPQPVRAALGRPRHRIVRRHA
jgi:hypothetical protein